MFYFTLDRILLALVILSAAGIFLIILRRLPKAMQSQRDVAFLVSKKSVEIPTSLDGILEMAEQYFKVKNFKTAENLYLKAASLSPTEPKIYNRLGIIYLENKNFRDAVAAFEQAVKIDPNVALRHANLGIAYLEMKKYTLAERAFKEAAKLNPGNKKYKKLLEESGIKK